MVAHAELPATRFARTAAVRPCREQVRHALPVIFELSVSLRDGAALNAREVAQLWLIVSDGAGPCYTRIGADSLKIELQRISASIVTGD